MLFYFFLVGIAQGFVTIIGSALCWGFYNKEKMVLAPTIVSRFLLFQEVVLTGVGQLLYGVLGILPDAVEKRRAEDVPLDLDTRAWNPRTLDSSPAHDTRECSKQTREAVTS